MFSVKRQTFIADPRDLLGNTKGKNMFYILFYSFLESYWCFCKTLEFCKFWHFENAYHLFIIVYLNEQKYIFINQIFKKL